ncbi:YetF domain-containing protein [Virgibacillus sp. JSM 102003]|uniref:YetF domain-containing protein n=1 Tax=Virgibacillus sp. JSM 102003 TaxID=1562108 RepID=UPI0035C0E138
MNIPELLVRIILAFLVLFILARIMGRKEISQMTFFNFVSAIAIGTIAGSLATSQNLSIRNGILALVGWALFTLVMGFIDIKSKGARKVTTGNPVIVIKDGKIMENSLRKTRLDIGSLNALLRQKNVFSMADVSYAIFETSGKLSVMKKEINQPVTKGDMNVLSTTPNTYPIATEVISDGVLNNKNLAKLNLDREWVESQINNANVDYLSQVFYAEVQQDGTLFIDKKDDYM